MANGTSKVGLIAYGTDFALRESRDQLAKEFDIKTDYLRLRAYPFTREVHEFVASHERVYVVEQNRDGQMASLLKLDLTQRRSQSCAACAITTGFPWMRGR